MNRVIGLQLEEMDIFRPDQIANSDPVGGFDQKAMLRQIELWTDKICPVMDGADT